MDDFDNIFDLFRFDHQHANHKAREEGDTRSAEHHELQEWRYARQARAMAKRQQEMLQAQQRLIDEQRDQMAEMRHMERENQKMSWQTRVASPEQRRYYHFAEIGHESDSIICDPYVIPKSVNYLANWVPGDSVEAVVSHLRGSPGETPDLGVPCPKCVEEIAYKHWLKHGD